MAEPHVITAFAKKRAELAGDIETSHAKLRQMILALEQLDATLLLFDPSYEIASIRPKAFRPPEDWSKRGEMTRLILGILRRATEPMTSQDIAIQLMIDRPGPKLHPRTRPLSGGRLGRRSRSLAINNHERPPLLEGCRQVIDILSQIQNANQSAESSQEVPELLETFPYLAHVRFHQRILPQAKSSTPFWRASIRSFIEPTPAVRVERLVRLLHKTAKARGSAQWGSRPACASMPMTIRA